VPWISIIDIDDRNNSLLFRVPEPGLETAGSLDSGDVVEFVLDGLDFSGVDPDQYSVEVGLLPADEFPDTGVPEVPGRGVYTSAYVRFAVE
jgi:hypothetical protein